MRYIFLSQEPNPEYRKIEGDIIVSDDDLIQVCYSTKGKCTSQGSVIDLQLQIRDKRGAPDVQNPSKKWPIDQVISYRIEGDYSKLN